MLAKLVTVIVMLEAGLGAVAIVALCLSVILFFTNRRRRRLGGINTAALKRAPVICLCIALPCFFMMPLVYARLKPNGIACWNEYAGEYMSSYDALIEYQGEEYVRLDMVIDTKQLKKSLCKGYLKYVEKSTGEKLRWVGDAVYEIENETGFPLLYVKGQVRTGETGEDVYSDDLYCRSQDQLAFLTACFEGDDTMYLMYQEDEWGDLDTRGFSSPREDLGITMDLWSSLYFLEETEVEYVESAGDEKPDYFLDAYFMNRLFSRQFHFRCDADEDKWYCFMDDEKGRQKEQIFKLPKKGQKYMNALEKK